MKKIAPVFKSWFAYATAITLVCGIIYVTVQQSYRTSANDPQLQMAEDAANAISKGAAPKTVIGAATPVEISESLSPYLVIYDSAGNMVASNASLNGAPLRIPKGVVDYVNKYGKDAATWQPEPGVRQAMVGIRSIGKGFIAFSGRSLRRVEERISILGEQVALGWIMSLIGMAVVLFIINAFTPRSALS
ncbi:hypothetical protein [Mucilaginibacter ginsenosidivorans]|uniref:Sensor histidine kinase n=1 Tax=Mucilaginibacter ginsenosidivorans TaxID=398053 RepID=A0A5B8UW66_9SPHI|nr:hypothetical protein [Mucilaginibacter ginsenosidivorans]QEC63377.1 hypothetical protein FRZ54_12590 [Mucilaginibacter ginsenosidivorans]